MLLDFGNLVNKYELKIKGIIHIGAHHGDESVVYENNNISNQIFFEPIKSNYDVLCQKLGDKYTKFNIALGNDNREIEMFVETNNRGMSSSMLEPKKHLSQYPHITFNNKELVKMTKLDDVDIDYSNFNFINIDVQGYELEVFKGAINSLKNIDYIMTEINRDELYKDCVQITELKEFLSSFGFEFVEETWDGGTWGDGFFIKKK